MAAARAAGTMTIEVTRENDIAHSTGTWESFAGLLTDRSIDVVALQTTRSAGRDAEAVVCEIGAHLLPTLFTFLASHDQRLLLVASESGYGYDNAVVRRTGYWQASDRRIVPRGPAIEHAYVNENGRKRAGVACIDDEQFEDALLEIDQSCSSAFMVSVPSTSVESAAMLEWLGCIPDDRSIFTLLASAVARAAEWSGVVLRTSYDRDRLDVAVDVFALSPASDEIYEACSQHLADDARVIDVSNAVDAD